MLFLVIGLIAACLLAYSFYSGVDPDVKKLAEEARLLRALKQKEEETKRANVSRNQSEHKPSMILANLIATEILKSSVENPERFSVSPDKTCIYSYKNEEKKWEIQWIMTINNGSSRIKINHLDINEFPKYGIKISEIQVKINSKPINFTPTEIVKIDKAIFDGYKFRRELEISRKEADRQMECIDAIAGYMGVEVPKKYNDMNNKPYLKALPIPETQLKNQIDDMMSVFNNAEKV